MFEMLDDFSSLPETIGEIKLHYSIIPKKIPVRVDEKRIKHNGEVWQINKYDADPFPSNPHAHNLETGLKIHLGNGGVYDSKNEITGIKRFTKKT